jgi:hypothetical protein
MRTVLVVLSLLLLPLSALADTFTIEDGTAFQNFGTMAFNVSGSNFSANGSESPTPFFYQAPVGGEIFRSTSRLFLSGGNYTFNGVSYNPLESGSTWTLSTEVLVPQGFTGGTLTGTANLRGEVSLENQLAARHTIVGSGPATFLLGPSELQRVDVAFEPSSPIGNTIGTSNGGTVVPPVSNTGSTITSPVNGAAPTTVPEPGTWLLMASGFGALALSRRRYAA